MSEEQEQKGADIRTGVIGDTGGWWVRAVSPRGEKKLGPYSSPQDAIQKCKELNATLSLQSRYEGPIK